MFKTKKFNNKNYHINWYPKDNLDESFRYTVIDNLFTDRFRKKLQKHFNKSLKNNELVKFPHYECDVMNVNPWNKNPFDFVYSLEWKEFISNMFPDIPITDNVLCEIQHHEKNTPNGWIHNDFDASHFGYKPLKNGINPWDKNSEYRLQYPPDDKEGYIKNVRSIVLMYHLNDKPDWKEGDGGETAFYDEYTKEVDDHFMKINPVGNRLITYEINPWSWHSFKANLKHKRTTIIMWYHTTFEDTYDRYGEVELYGKKTYKEQNNRVT